MPIIKKLVNLTMNKPITSARACGKIILFGEHAVVYNQPAIAVPLQAISAVTEVIPTAPGSGFYIVVPQTNREFRFLAPHEGSENSLIYTARLVLNHLHAEEPDVILSLRSTIPQKSGFGSGAAVSIAIVRALGNFLGQSLPDAIVNDIVYEVEKMHHGTPSGIDNTVIAFERPLFFVKNQPNKFIHIKNQQELLVATLPHSTPTKVTVSDVRYLYTKHPRRVQRIFRRIGDIAQQARIALETGEVSNLGSLMNENHKLLKRLTVSDSMTDKLCRSALKAGALGAKLSGGGRGGNMIALVTPETRGMVNDVLLKHGAIRVIHTTLE